MFTFRHMFQVYALLQLILFEIGFTILHLQLMVFVKLIFFTFRHIVLIRHMANRIFLYGLCMNLLKLPEQS